MILKRALHLSKSIDDYRQNIYKLTKDKRISDSQFIKINHQLDEEMIMLQKVIDTIRSSPGH